MLPKERGKKTLFGALSLRTQKFFWKQADKGNATYFREFLLQLHQAHPNKKLVLILDNGPIHRAGCIARFAERHPWLKLYYLPAYSPEYNPIERFWKWLKKVVYGASSYGVIDEVIKRIRQVIWHYNEGWLKHAIRFEFGIYGNLL